MVTGQLCILFILAGWFTSTGTPAEQHKEKPRIAIVGAGISGAAAAYLLRQLFQEGIDIDIYEKKTVGGRLASAKVGEHLYEMGGSALHRKNKYMANFVDELGLKRRHVFGIRLGLFDGKQYMVMQGDRPVSDFGKLFHRYGNSISEWHNVIDDILERFLKIYKVQEEGYTFTTVEKLLAAADPLMVNLTRISARKYLLDRGILPAFVNEVVTGITRICYGQTPDVNAFVGTISLAGAKAGLWGVRGGNEKVPLSLIQRSDANLIQARVTDVILHEAKPGTQKSRPHPKFEIQTAPSVEQRKASERPSSNIARKYDMVILATPLAPELSDGIRFENFPGGRGRGKEGMAEWVGPYGSYQPSVTTLVSGTLNASYLESNRALRESELDEVLTTTEYAPFNSLTRVYPVDIDEELNQTTNVWKLVTSSVLSKEQLDTIFVDRKATVSREWLAYPRYTPPELLGPLRLHPGLFYTSSIDWAASAIEMSIISAKNAALLAYYHWNGDHQQRIDSYPGHRDEL